jgi:hypothetical protein
MLVGLFPTAAFAAGETWTDNAPTVTFTVGTLEDNAIVVKIHVSGATNVEAYSLGVVYDTAAVEINTSLGSTKRPGFESTLPASEDWSVQYTSAKESTETGKKVELIAATSGTETVGVDDFELTYYFKLTEAYVKSGGQFSFKLDETDFKVANSDGDSIAYPSSGTSGTVTVPIGEAAITGTIATPVKGEAPSAKVEPDNKNVDADVTWEPEMTDGDKFKASTTYTAVVTAYAKTGFTFADDAEITYNGKAMTKKTGYDGATIYQYEIKYDETAAKTLTDIAITTQPTKIKYLDDENFDPTGMVVKATYDDGSEETITNYTVSPETIEKSTTATTDTVTVTITSGGKTATLNVTVTGKSGAASQVELGTTEAEYTGSDLTETFTNGVTKGNLTATPSITFKQNGQTVSPINAGTYDVYVTITGDTHYANVTEEEIGTVTVEPKKVSPVIADINSVNSVTYNGAAQEPAIKVTVGNETFDSNNYKVSYKDNTNAGTATVTIEPVTGGNYTFDGTSKNFTISKKTVGLTWPTERPRYDGTEQKKEAEVTGIYEGDTATLTYSGNTGTDAGEYTATVTGINNSNYALPTDDTTTCSWGIDKASHSDLTYNVTVPTTASEKTITTSELGLGADFKDVTIATAAVGTNDSGLIDGNITNNSTSITFKTGSTTKGATATITLTIDSKNYTTTKLTITLTSADVTFTAWPTFTTTYTYGKSNGDAVNLTTTTATGKDGAGNDVTGTLSVVNADTVQNAGSGTITLQFTVTDGDYKGASVTQTYDVTIDKAQTAVQWSNTTLTYSGEAQKPTATAAGVNNETLTLTVNGEQTNVGTGYSAAATIESVSGGNASAENYELTGTPTTFTIQPKTVSGIVNVTWTDAKVISGTVLTADITGVLPETAQSGLTYQWYRNDTAIENATGSTYTAADADVGAKVKVTVTASGNYTGSISGNEISVLKTALTGTLTIAVEKAQSSETTETDSSGDTAADTGDSAATDASSADSTAAEAAGTDSSSETTAADANSADSSDDTADAGDTLRATVEANTTDANYEIVWLRDGVKFGATGETYTLTDDDKGCTITAQAEAKGDLYEGTITTEDQVKVNATAPSFDEETAAPTANAGNSSVTVTLEAKANGANITKYVITYKATDSEDDATTVEVEANEDGTIASSYTITGLTNGTEYTITVQAVNSVGESEAVTLTATPESTKTYDPIYKVTVRSGNNGTVQASPGVAKPGTLVTLTPVPSEGYALDTLTVNMVSGRAVEVTEKDGVYTFTMPYGSVIVQATFKSTGTGTTGGTTGTTGGTTGTTGGTTGKDPSKDTTGTNTGDDASDTNTTPVFTDVPADAYYAEAVAWAVEKGITIGTSATTFSPDDNCTRGEAMTFLWRAAGSPEPESTECSFTDLVEGSYYYKAVLWAVEKGITKGTSETTFSPEETITRAQMVTFLYRLAKASPTETEVPFVDVPENAYYAEAVAWAVEKGVTKGTSETTFSPNEDCLRGQTVTFLYRTFN